MRLLHVIRSLDPAAGGVTEHLAQYSPVAAQLGHHVEIASLDAPEAPWLGTWRVPVHGLGPVHGNYGYSPGIVPWLRSRGRDFDAVVVDGLWQYHGYAVHRALAGQTPYFVFPHGMLDPWFKTAYPLKHIKKSIYWRLAEYRVLRDARLVLFTAEEERRRARESFSPYRCREEVVTLGTAAPPGDPEAQRRQFQQQYPATQGRRVALFLGRLHEKKGCDLLIEAFARTAARSSDWHLVMAGPGSRDWLDRLRAQAAALGVANRITWTGMVSGDLKWGAFHSAEIFVLPSHQENFGITVAETLACGVPALISNKVNIWREVEQSGAGFAAEDTLDGTASLFERWLALPKQRQDAMRKNARACFTGHFEIAAATKGILDAIERTL